MNSRFQKYASLNNAPKKSFTIHKFAPLDGAPKLLIPS